MDQAALERKLRDSELGQALYSYMRKRGALPTATVDPNLYKNRKLWGLYEPLSHRVSIDAADANGNTILHEYMHAGDHTMRNQYYDRDFRFAEPKEPTQFTDAYHKLVESAYPESKKQRIEFAKRLDPKWTEKNKDYRSNQDELAGWGADAVIPPIGKLEYQPPLHLNPTMATEFSILLDLANREKSTTKNPRDMLRQKLQSLVDMFR